MTEKSIYIRAGLLPEDRYPVRDICRNNRIGNNVGNLLYLYSILRFLRADGRTKIVADRYRPENGLVGDADIDRINREMSCYILPMADAFRRDFEPHLKKLTAFIKKLRIPVILMGAGISAKIDEDTSFGTMKPAFSGMASEKSIKEFLSAVLDHSACLGLRGGAVLAYLKTLGFREDTHMTVIGCPSLYMFGPSLSVSEPDFSPESRWILTNNIYADTKVHALLARAATEHPNFLFIPQRTEELKMMYLGKDLDTSRFPKNKPDYPVSLSSIFYSGGHAVFPLDVPSWLACVRGAGLSVGPRLHGSIACMLAGVPALMIARDRRMLEVAEYHRLPCIRQTDLTGAEEVEELFARADYREMQAVSGRNYGHFLDFLRKNELAVSAEGLKRNETGNLSGRAQYRTVAAFTDVSKGEQLLRRIPDPKSLAAACVKRLFS